MKRTIGISVAAAALCSLALAGCGGGSAGAPSSTGSTAPAVPSVVEPADASTTPSPSPTSKEDKDKVFVADVRAKVASGDYTPTKESTAKSRKNIQVYLTALTDDRLAAVGEYNCSVKRGVAKTGTTFSRRDFEKLELKNTGLEEGFKPLLGLTWDEAVKTICPD